MSLKSGVATLNYPLWVKGVFWMHISYMFVVDLSLPDSTRLIRGFNLNYNLSYLKMIIWALQ